MSVADTAFTGSIRSRVRGNDAEWPDRRTAYILLAAIVLIAALLRVPTLATQSLWLDEVASYLQARGGFVEMIQATAEDNYPPLHNVVLWLSIKLFGEGEWALRVPSAIAGILNVAAIYWVGTIVGGRRTGLIAALLLAVSAFHLFYSQEARMYALLALTATLFAGSMIAYLSRPGLAWAAAAVLGGTALVYSHPYGLLTWGAVAAGAGFAVLRAGRLWPLAAVAAIQACIALAFTPWALIMVGRAQAVASGFWILTPTPASVLDLFEELLSAQLGLIAVGVIVGGWVADRWRAGYWIVVAWAVLPFVLALAVSLWVQPILLSRYCIAILPALFILAAQGFSRLVEHRSAFAALALGLVMAGVYGIYAGSPLVREDWRGVAAWLDAEMAADDCIVVSKATVRSPLHYYRPPGPCETYASQADQLRAEGYPARVFLVASHISDRDLEPIADSLAARHGEPSRKTFRGVRILIYGPPQ